MCYFLRPSYALESSDRLDLIGAVLNNKRPDTEAQMGSAKTKKRPRGKSPYHNRPSGQ